LEQGRLVGRPQVMNRGRALSASPALATERIARLDRDLAPVGELDRIAR